MKTNVLIVGGFHKAKSLANSLIKKGYSVTVINNDLNNCQDLADIEHLNVIYGDGTKPFVLEDSNTQDMDIVIALTRRDDDNLVICELCKKRFNVKKTVAVVNDPKKAEFFYKMGIDSVVSAISTITSIIEQHAFLDEISNVTNIGDGRVSIAEVPITESSPVVGKKLWELNLPKEVIIGCILRGDTSLIPRGDTRLFVGDMIVLLSTHQHEMLAIKELTGK